MKLSRTPLLTNMLLTTLLFAPIAYVSQAAADQVTVPIGQQGADKASLARPVKGMTSQQVETKFGAPLQKSTPVGKPPISSWEYPEYRVYFEGNRVLHSVLKPMPTEADDVVTEAAPTPATPAVVAPESKSPEVIAPKAEATEKEDAGQASGAGTESTKIESTEVKGADKEATDKDENEKEPAK